MRQLSTKARFCSVLVLLGLSGASAGRERVSLNAIYLSADGNDAQDGRSPAQALRTPAYAVQLVETIGAPATVYLDGVFELPVPIVITPAAGNSMWTSRPGRSASLRPAGTNRLGIMVKGASKVTIAGLSLSGFRDTAILNESGKNVVIKNNIVKEALSTGWSQAAIHMRGFTAGSVIHGNHVEGADYAGILVDTNAESDVSDVIISDNSVTRVCRKVKDCGAIYVNDRGRRSAGIRILRNFIKEFGPQSLMARGIYLDDWASGVMVDGNRIAGPGGYAFQIHGGSHNLLTDNQIDLGNLAMALLLQPMDDKPTSRMRGNVVERNRFHSDRELSELPMRPSAPLSAGTLRRARNELCVSGRGCRFW